MKKSLTSMLMGQRYDPTAPEYCIDQAELEALMGNVFEAYGKSLPTEVLMAWELQLRGGPCPRKDCGAPFLPKRVLNVVFAKDRETGEVLKDGEDNPIVLRTFADFTMHYPGCHCYKRCEVGGLWVSKGGGRREVTRITGCGDWLVAERLLTDHGVDLSGTGTAQKECLSCGLVIL